MDFSDHSVIILFHQALNMFHTMLSLAIAIICYQYFTKNRTEGTKILAWSAGALFLVGLFNSFTYLFSFVLPNFFSSSLNSSIYVLSFLFRVAFVYGLYLVLKEYSGIQRLK